MFLSCIWLTCFVHRLGRSSFVPADSKFKRWSMSNSFCQIHTVWCFVFAWHCGKDCDYAWAFPRAAHGIQPTFDGKHVLVVGKVLSLKHQGSIDCPGGCTSKPCCYSICISKFSRSTRLSEACLKHTEANPFKCSQRLCHFLCIPILPPCNLHYPLDHLGQIFVQLDQWPVPFLDVERETKTKDWCHQVQ